MSIVVGSGAGVGASAVIGGNDQAGVVDLTIGAVGWNDPNNRPLFTVNFSVPFASKPVVVLTPLNVNANNLVGANDVYVNHSLGTASSFTVSTYLPLGLANSPGNGPAVGSHYYWGWLAKV